MSEASVFSSLVPLLGTNAVQHSTKSTLGGMFQLHIFKIIESCSELCSSSLSDLHDFHCHTELPSLPSPAMLGVSLFRYEYSVAYSVLDYD